MLQKRTNGPRGVVAPLFRDFERWVEEDFPAFQVVPEWFGRAFGDRRWGPAMDVREEADLYRVNVDLPGLAKKDIDVRVEDNRLVIEGERKIEEKVDEDRYHRFERAYGKFHRDFLLPGSVDPEAVKAKFKDGVLEVTIPKLEETKPRKVLVE